MAYANNMVASHRKRIALVQPRGSNWFPGVRDITDIANRMAPLGILSVGAYLLQKGHDVFMYDGLGPFAPRDLDEQVRAVLKWNPQIVGFSATTSSFPDAAVMAKKVKEHNPSIRTICGGVHVSSTGEFIMVHYPQFDYIAAGEGERLMAEVAEDCSPETIPGLIWREHDNVMVNAPGPPIADLDTLPFPAYEKLDGFPRHYHLPLFSYVHTPGATMISSRGCMYQCSFCDRSVFKKTYRYNSASYIYEHLHFLRKRFQVRHVNIYDDLFTLNRKRIVEICDRLTHQPLGMQFNCAVRVGYADDELLGMLKEAGCLMVSVGIESADPALLERHKAGVSVDEVRDTVMRIHRAGLRAKGLFIMGLPGETEESIRKTSDFIISLGLDDMNMSKFTPFPGAPLWSTIRQEGDFEENWSLMNCLNFVFLPKDISSRERLDELYNEHVKRFYLDPAWRKKFCKRLWQHRHSLVYFFRHLRTFLAAKRQLQPGQKIL